MAKTKGVQCLTMVQVISLGEENESPEERVNRRISTERIANEIAWSSQAMRLREENAALRRLLRSCRHTIFALVGIVLAMAGLHLWEALR